MCRLKTYLGNLEAEMFEEVEARMKMISDVPYTQGSSGCKCFDIRET